MTATEEWRPVIGYEGYYEVSSHGRVRSLPRPRRRRTVVLRPATVDVSGHVVVVLHGGGTRRTRTVHKLVAEAFIGPCPDGMEVCHNNGDGSDSRLENLRYDTRSANTHDKIAHGKHPFASRSACSNGHRYTKLTTRIRVGTSAKGLLWVSRTCRECERDRARAKRDLRKARAA